MRAKTTNPVHGHPATLRSPNVSTRPMEHDTTNRNPRHHVTGNRVFSEVSRPEPRVLEFTRPRLPVGTFL